MSILPRVIHRTFHSIVAAKCRFLAERVTLWSCGGGILTSVDLVTDINYKCILVSDMELVRPHIPAIHCQIFCKRFPSSGVVTCGIHGILVVARSAEYRRTVVAVAEKLSIRDIDGNDD